MRQDAVMVSRLVVAVILLLALATLAAQYIARSTGAPGTPALVSLRQFPRLQRLE